MGQEQSNFASHSSFTTNNGGEILDRIRKNGKLDGASEFGVARNSRVSQSMTTYDNFEKNILRANALAAMVEDSLGIRLSFSVRPFVKSRDILKLLWKIGTPLAVRVEQSLLGDEPTTTLMTSARGFYFVYLALEDFWTSIQVCSSPGREQVDSLHPWDESPNECPICQDSDVDVVLPCTHSMCRECYLRWMQEQENCPLCRQVQEGGEDELWELTEVADIQNGDALAHFQALRCKIRSFLVSLPREDGALPSFPTGASSSAQVGESAQSQEGRGCDKPVVVSCPARTCRKTYAVPHDLQSGFFRCPTCGLMARLPNSWVTEASRLPETTPSSTLPDEQNRPSAPPLGTLDASRDANQGVYYSL